MNSKHHSHHPQHEHSGSGQLSVSAKHADARRLKTKPSHDEVARKAYEIYEKESCPQGYDMQHWLKAEAKLSVQE